MHDSVIMGFSCGVDGCGVDGEAQDLSLRIASLAPVALLLVSAAAAGMTGQTLNVDAGSIMN
ncbi:MAG TPA: hypothetical protein VMV27_12530 [Candidatus Binataceae bacterium]|nr:hypothetical protein [Candidatus Binataceae bacterium]